METNADAEQRHREQREYWNGSGGAKWLAAQDRTDAMLSPVSSALLNRIDFSNNNRLYDIGCGCGATTLDIADNLGAAGHVTGFDISVPMLDRGRERAEGRKNVTFELADASTYAFVADADMLISRFGVMFFGDPAAAFGNMRRALKPGGRLLFACWRPFDENLWMKTPLEAAYRHVPRLPKPGPDDPGPFSFADPDRVSGILKQAGFSDLTLDPVDMDLDLGAGGGLAAALEQCTMIGAASRALQDQPSEIREAAIEEIRKSLTPFANGVSVMLPAAIWIVSAH